MLPPAKKKEAALQSVGDLKKYEKNVYDSF